MSIKHCQQAQPGLSAGRRRHRYSLVANGSLATAAPRLDKRAAQAKASGSRRLKRGGDGAKPEAADGKEAEGRTPGVAMINGEWHKRAAMIMLASVAQQGVAAEAVPHSSHGYF